jgi:SPP1 gp7 family putative phage head morphogenesis protein
MNNERQLERALQKYFKNLEKQIQRNLKFYWQDNLVVGQVDLITEPIMNSHDDYYKILERYIIREYQLGTSEAERLIQQLNPNRVANKARIPRPKPLIRKVLELFGTIEEAEQDLLHKTFIASQRTLMRITNQINQIITDGYRSGKGINVVANDLTRRFGQLQTWESKRIARTEIHNSHNKAVIDKYNETGVQYTMWITAHDDRVRGLKPTDTADHVALDGEIIRLGDTYSNGLRYPGDTDGPIEEWINCRCSNAPYVLPYGFAAPPQQQFTENDLIKIR